MYETFKCISTEKGSQIRLSVLTAYSYINEVLSNPYIPGYRILLMLNTGRGSAQEALLSQVIANTGAELGILLI